MDYAKVIVPLKLEWEPFYSIPQGLAVSVGRRVRVRLSGREYQGVVHSVGETPDIEPSRIQAILGVEDDLPLISKEELQMWEFLADYYMCTIGEVYNAAYPAARRDSEGKNSRRRASAAPPGARVRTSSADLELCRRIFDVFAEGKPALLLDGGVGGTFSGRVPGSGTSPASGGLSGNAAVVSSLIRHTVEGGRSVLVLTPDVTDAPDGCLEYNSASTPAARRDVASEVRSSRPCVVFGTRISVFLPFVNLGLVVVLDEHDSLYKQNEPSPRYNGRDAAVKLASIHGADVLLCSSVPSLESLLNCINGKYVMVRTTEQIPSVPSELSRPEFELVDTTAERRKNGMRGSYSRKLLSLVDETLACKRRVLVVVPWKDTDDLEIELRSLYPEARTKIVFCPLAECRRRDFSKFGLVALIRAEFLLGGEDFRSDERGLRELAVLRRAVSASGLTEGAAGPPLVIQTADAAHPVFAGLDGADICTALESLLPLRRQFNLPPYSRLVDLVFKDSNEPRRRKMRLAFSSLFPAGIVAGMTEDRIRLCLPKNASLPQIKREIYRKVCGFAAERRYSGFVFFDVDPLSRH